MIKIVAPIFFLALVVFSCDDKEAKPDNFFSAEKNGLPWNGRADMAYDQNFSGDTLIIWGLGADETLAMMIRFTGTGHYPIQKYQGTFYTTLGGDVLTSIYQTDDGNYTGALRITRYDEAEKIIEGNFEVSLKQTESHPPSGVEVVSFTRGQFRGKIRN